MKRKTIRELMTTEVVTLEKEQAVPLAQELMRMLHIRNLPVVDDQGRFVGLVTQPSLLAAQVEMLSEMGGEENVERELSVPVARVMTIDTHTVTPDTSVAEALRLMIENKAASLPVVENHRVVGIVTVKDFLKLALSNLEEREGRVGAATPAMTNGSASPIQPIGTEPGASSMQRWATVGLLTVILLLTAVLVFKEFDRPGSSYEGTATASNGPQISQQGGTAPDTTEDAKTETTTRERATSRRASTQDRAAAAQTARTTKRRMRPAPKRRTAQPTEEREEALTPPTPQQDQDENPRQDEEQPTRWVPEPVPDPL